MPYSFLFTRKFREYLSPEGVLIPEKTIYLNGDITLNQIPANLLRGLGFDCFGMIPKTCKT